MRKNHTKLLLAGILVLSGCEPMPAHQVHHHHAGKNAIVHEYHEKSGDDWVYWYIINADTTSPVTRNSPAPSSYYYRSTTPVTNFTTAPFTRVAGSLPKEVQQEVEKSEEIGKEELTPENEPQDVQQENEVEAEAADSAAESTDAGSSDSGGDSGGGGE